jgi:hypothetical protein
LSAVIPPRPKAAGNVKFRNRTRPFAREPGKAKTVITGRFSGFIRFFWAKIVLLRKNAPVALLVNVS